VINIDEVKITASPVKIKNDTVEFNASAIKVRPDSNLQELLKQVPGVEISNDDKITVNGKAVDKIMVNGKPFFDKDGKWLYRIFLPTSLKISSLPRLKQKRKSSAKDLRNLRIPPSILILMKRKTKDSFPEQLLATVLIKGMRKRNAKLFQRRQQAQPYAVFQ
jgi:hypothetical protein